MGFRSSSRRATRRRRLPGKAAADIAGKPMIVRVLDRAREAARRRRVVSPPTIPASPRWSRPPAGR